jgi:hypothetical protein
MTSDAVFLVLNQPLFQNIIINSDFPTSILILSPISAIVIVEIQYSILLLIETLEMDSKGNDVDQPPTTDCSHLNIKSRFT